MSEEHSGDLQPEGAKENVGKRGERVNCNGEMLRTSEPLKDGSKSENERHMDSTGGEVCGSVDTRWAEDEHTASNSKDPTHNNHNSGSSSSEDETEGQEDFAANWYVPLPQDPRESDEDEEGEGGESEQWSKAATGSRPLQKKQGGEEVDEEEGQDASVQQVAEVKAASQMEDSEL